jgi:hypothetical protein
MFPLTHHFLHATIAVQNTLTLTTRQVSSRLAQRRAVAHEQGEGVISVALAVLIMAGLAGIMWVAYRAMIVDANENVSKTVGDLGKG